MATKLQNNGINLNGYNHQKNSVDLKQKTLQAHQTTQLKPQNITLTQFTPEAEKVRELVDKRLWKIHLDENIAQFASYFSELIQKNEKVFANKPSQTQAQIAFDYYRDRFVAWIEKDAEYQSLQEQMIKNVKECVPAFLDDEAKSGLANIVRQRMHGWHSTLIEVALEKTQKDPININLHSLPDQYQPRDLENPTIDLFV